MYHINHEGKVYPCRATVYKCPYGDKMHARTREELYYKFIRDSYASEPKRNKKVIRDVDEAYEDYGGMTSLAPISDTIERSGEPVVDIIRALEHSLGNDKDTCIEYAKKANRSQDEFYDEADYYIQRLYKSGYRKYEILKEGEVDDLSEDLLDRVRRTWIEQGAYIDTDESQRIGAGRPDLVENAFRMLNGMNMERYNKIQEHIVDVNFYHSHEYEENIEWQQGVFLKFSHDLNTSKMLTQSAPLFYGDLKTIHKTISEMDNYELLATYDDYNTPDTEIIENVQMANNFHYTPRSDLSHTANSKLAEWYKRNQKVYETWQEYGPERILIALKLAKELDRRGIYRLSCIRKVGD